MPFILQPPSLRSAPRCSRAQTIALVTLTAVGLSIAPALAAPPAQPGSSSSAFGHQRRIQKLDDELTRRARIGSRSRRSRLIVQLGNGQTLPASLRAYQSGNRLDLINGYVLDVPDNALADVASQVEVASAHVDRPIWAADYLSTHSTAADVAHDTLGFTGEGIGVAVIDSGVATWHDDLTEPRGRSGRFGNQRVSRFVDFVNGQQLPYDDHGHGSHVAGIILGNGYDSNGRHAGMAPDASLVALKVLDKDGKGTVSNIIAALDWVAVNARAYNIRVVNLSAGAGVSESYWTDPLTIAAKHLVDRGIVVVAASGNLGKNAEGEHQYGGILSPGNAPWVLTVGASSTEGTAKRSDDVMAAFSSSGPTRGDYLAKPDLVAPGYGILSLAVPGSTLYAANQAFLVRGERRTANPPYLALSGTSMAAPQVSGVVALMLQANPSLTPNLVKAILQYTAQSYPEYSPLEQGAGFLDALSAVRLSTFYAKNTPGATMPIEPTWSRHIVWGNHLIAGGSLDPLGNAWSSSVVWGATSLASGDNIVWGTSGADNIVWGTAADENIVWGTSTGTNDNIVWGTDCGGADCRNVVWGASNADNIVWGTSQDDNIVWGTAQPDDNIVWGTSQADNIVWGTNSDDNIVWGTASDDNIVWGTSADDNIVWGTAAPADNIVWGTAQDDNIVWGTSRQGDDRLWSGLGRAVSDGSLWGPDGIFATPAPRWP